MSAFLVRLAVQGLVRNTVDELGPSGRAEAFCQFGGFVDRGAVEHDG